jgi:hypothetical protein
VDDGRLSRSFAFISSYRYNKKTKHNATSEHNNNNNNNNNNNSSSSNMAGNYEFHANEAVKFWEQGEKKKAANSYYLSFLAAPPASHNWEPTQYHQLHGYTSILREKYFPPTTTDLKNLKKIAHKQSLPKLYRQEAAWTLGLLAWDAGDRLKAADYYREALQYINQAESSERERKMFASLDLNGKPTTGLHSVSLILEESKNTIEDNLGILNNPTGARALLPDSEFVRSDGTTMPREIRTSAIPLDADPSSLAKRLKVGGNECDECGKTWQELGKPRLDCCPRCQNAFYCSQQCYKNAVRNGHKGACRKEGQIEPGDIMKLQGIKAKPQLNGSLVKVLRKDRKSEGRWEVQLLVTKSGMSIATGRLVHIRPEK